MLFALLNRAVGTLYPAYASYKAVRTKNVKEYVRWMMYWIVYAFFSSAEPFADIFIGFWFPFYYYLKLGILCWLMAPATNGSSLLYKKFIHPSLEKREEDIDSFLEEAKTKGISTFKQIGGRGLRYITQIVMDGMIRAPTVMAQFVETGQLSIESRRIEDVTDVGSGDGASGSGHTSAASAVQPKPHSQQPQQMEVDVTENESDFNLECDGEPVKKKAGRPRKASRATSSNVDLTFSSGDEQDPEFKMPQKRTRNTTRKPKKQ